MAIHTPIISPCHSEAVPSFRPTPVTIQFGAVMRDLSVYIEAERDLDVVFHLITIITPQRFQSHMPAVNLRISI